MQAWMWLLGLAAAAGGGIAAATFATGRLPARVGAVAAGVGGSAGLAWIIIAGISRREAIYADYLADCVMHRPRYECVLLWRASDRKAREGDPVIVPVPMPR